MEELKMLMEFQVLVGRVQLATGLTNNASAFVVFVTLLITIYYILDLCLCFLLSCIFMSSIAAVIALSNFNTYLIIIGHIVYNTYLIIIDHVVYNIKYKMSRNYFNKSFFLRDQITTYSSAVVELVLSALISVLLMDPVGTFHLHTCGVEHFSDWYTLFYNPSPNYVSKLHCTQEAVYPL